VEIETLEGAGYLVGFYLAPPDLRWSCWLLRVHEKVQIQEALER
jgi:hypothetical protein